MKQASLTVAVTVTVLASTTVRRRLHRDGIVDGKSRGAGRGFQELEQPLACPAKARQRRRPRHQLAQAAEPRRDLKIDPDPRRQKWHECGRTLPRVEVDV